MNSNNLPLMPKATAVWLIENTTLTFQQVSEFCGLHLLEVQGIADGEVAVGIAGLNPVAGGQLSQEQIEACQKDPNRKLHLTESAKRHLAVKNKKKGARYTPVARRQDKPDAISWLLKHYPDITDTQIVKLIGTTKNTIAALRERTHWNIANIKPRDPVLLGLCSQSDLDRLSAKLKMVSDKNAPEASDAQLTGTDD